YPHDHLRRHIDEPRHPRTHRGPVQGDTDRDTFVITLPAGVAVRGAAVGRRRRNDDVLLHRPSARPAPPPTSPGVPRGAGSEEKAPSPGHQPRPLPQAARGGPLTRSHPKPPDEHAHLATHPPVTGSVRITAHRAGPPPPSSTPSAVTHQKTQRLPARARWPTRPGSQGPSSAPPRHRATAPSRPPAGQPATAAACPRHQEPDRTLLTPGCTSCGWVAVRHGLIHPNTPIRHTRTDEAGSPSPWGAGARSCPPRPASRLLRSGPPAVPRSARATPLPETVVHNGSGAELLRHLRPLPAGL